MTTDYWDVYKLFLKHAGLTTFQVYLLGQILKVVSMDIVMFTETEQQTSELF